LAKNPNKKRCTATSKSTGDRCKNWATPGFNVCRFHGSRGGAPKKNSNARTHGLFAKYLPDETLEIMDSINEINPLDILWTNIKMQFASIIRAQQIMFVENKDDHTTFKTYEKDDEFGASEQIEVHASWDRQATFMNSLSRSMAELRNMLKQYVELSTHDDDRLLEIKRMQAQIDKTNAEIEQINKENATDAPPEITIIDEWADGDDQ